MYTPAHRHIAQPHATTHTTPKAAYVEYSARDFLLSVALFSTLLNREVIVYTKTTLSSVAEYMILAHYAHIRLRLPG